MADSPRRSILYMPGSNARALEKARSLPADGFIFDLEDAVGPDAKETARQQVAAAVRGGGYGSREVLIRVNAMSTPWGRDDLASVAQAGADGIVLPKVERPSEVQEALGRLLEAGAPENIAIWCMIETPFGVLRAAEIAGASPNLRGFIMGTSDLAKDLRCQHTPDRQPMLTALGLSLLAARAHGLAILDGVYLDLNDEVGFDAACQQGRALGFDGKTLIHPKQIEAANRAFAPSAEDVETARRIVDAFAEATRAGKGVVLLDGRLVENLHVEIAKRTLALAEAIGAT